jgi:hypothetical protein
VNFLLHRFLATRDLGSEIAGIGAMLPDLWRMVDRRVRPVSGATSSDAGDELSLILSGIEHHLDVDRWFHSAEGFVEGERTMSERLRASRVDAPKLGLFAHVAWELCLDGALLRREGFDETLQSLRDGFAAVAGPPVDRAVSLHHFDRIDRPIEERRRFDQALRGLFAELAQGRLIAGYRTGAGVARRIEGIRLRFGFPRFAEPDRQRLGEVFDAVASQADVALAELTRTGKANDAARSVADDG